ncbi:hypothetical protein F5983_02940 [Streptomyces arboris]|uniref:Uncharacterized protein n=1 Tax=Streptomyces arboris TaxID=2600619 RepID=A0A5N5ESX0_9ACTN|nr:hypothetical protein F5983_02940 [Streptomyces arboris]
MTTRCPFSDPQDPASRVFAIRGQGPRSRRLSRLGGKTCLAPDCRLCGRGVRAGAGGPRGPAVGGVRQNPLHRRHHDLASPGRRRGFLCVNCPCSNVFTPMSS